MANIYYDKDANMELLKGKRIGVLGFGSQGHAHAMNLKDSGFEVMVGLRPDSNKRKIAEDYGLAVGSIRETTEQCDMIMVLLPDEHHGEVYRTEIAPFLKPGKMLMFGHGFSIHFSQIIPPENVDVVLTAPKSPGHIVRREYREGRGVPGLLAVYRDASGKAAEYALAYAAAIGLTRAGVFETTFREETETDLFGEQAVLCGGVTALIKTGFETLVEAGYQPEMAYFECLNELKLIVDLIYEGGFSLMRYSVSNTAEYGDYITQNKIATPQLKDAMRQILRDIQGGRFAKEWILEKQAGMPSMNAYRRNEREHSIEKVGEQLRAMMPWISRDKIQMD